MATKAKKTPTKKTTAKSNGTQKSTKTKRPRKLAKNQNAHPRRLRGTLLLKLRAASLELEVKRQKLATINAELNAMSMDPVMAPVFMKLKKKDAISSEIKEAAQGFAEVQKLLATKFSIPLEKLHLYTFDTDTGAIIPSPIANKET